MFMSAVVNSSAEPTSTDKPGRAGRLIDLVRRLIDYGKELAATFQQRGTPTPPACTFGFGTRDIALILARITSGLRRAQALEARLVRSAFRLDAEPGSQAAPSPRTLRTIP